MKCITEILLIQFLGSELGQPVFIHCKLTDTIFQFPTNEFRFIEFWVLLPPFRTSQIVFILFYNCTLTFWSRISRKEQVRPPLWWSSFFRSLPFLIFFFHFIERTSTTNSGQSKTLGDLSHCRGFFRTIFDQHCSPTQSSLFLDVIN